METYHRKRSKRGSTIEAANNEMISLNGKETCSVMHGPQAPLARQPRPDPSYEVSDEEVESGNLYEVNHTNLSPVTPAKLSSTRVVMVTAKTDLKVLIRYPSVSSLKTYLGCEPRVIYPAFDKKLEMRIQLARKVLMRKVSSQEFAEKKHSEGFWLVNSNNTQFGSKVVLKNEDIGMAQELNKNEMELEDNVDKTNTEENDAEVETDQEENGSQAEVDKEENEVEAESDQEDDEVETKPELEEKTQDKKPTIARNMKKGKTSAMTDPSNRWSEERYMAAELSLLEAMKAKKAMIGNPITRHALRLEARMRIGDTGLLDHLLKHVANRVAPGGSLRFRRSHNASGTIEYWLEDADLLKIRRDAGVNDPFWTPPPGWKPGDSPIQDPIVAKELNNLKEELSYMKKEFLPKKMIEIELARMRSEYDVLTSKITRPALRFEARKRIGDARLLDHLINSEFDVLTSKITRPAPPGWKPGDSPIQDPIVAKELNNLKEELSYMKREFLPKKVIEIELARMRSEFDVLTSKIKEDQSQAIVVSNFVDTSLQQVMDFCKYLLTSESQTTDEVDNSIISQEKCKKQVLVISDFLKKLQAWTQAVEVGKQTTKMEATSISQTVSNAQKHSENPILTEDKDKNEAAVALAKQSSADGDQETSDAQKQEQPAPPEGKASKIERLKSGLRHCRPQGTFLWPNLVKTPTSNMSSSSQVEDHFVVPIPPSVNSSTQPQLPYFSHHHLLNLASPVKPVPEKRPLTITISAVSHPQTASSTPNLINLNDIPTNPSTTIKPSNLLSSEMMNDHSWEAYGAMFPSGGKKRKISYSSPAAFSEAPLSCFSNTTTPAQASP